MRRRALVAAGAAAGLIGAALVLASRRWQALTRPPVRARPWRACAAWAARTPGPPRSG